MTTRIGAQRPRLSNIPAAIDNTEAGDEVIEFARRFGIELDDWQQWVVSHVCAERSDGSWAAPTSILLVPRQCGKSLVLEVLEMAALFLWEYQHTIYSAHLQKTSTDHMRRIKQLLSRFDPDEKLARMLTGRGDERVEVRETGAILEFITRGRKTARGGSPNLVIFDEALFLQDDQVQAMLPALSAQSMNEDGAAQMVYASSAPIYESEVLHRLRKKAIQESPPRMFFAEWSVDVEADPRDRSNWYLANPGLGVRISEEWVADQEFGVLSPTAFAVERLGIPLGGDGEAGVVPFEKWELLKVPAHPPPRVIDVAYGLSVSPDGSWSAVGSAGRMPNGDLYVDKVEYRRGTEWVVAFVAELCQRKRSTVRVNPAAAEGALIRPLLDARVDVVEVESREYQQACGMFLFAVENGTLRHLGQESMNNSVTAAGRRDIGREGAWVWVRPGAVDISPLTAATNALTGVVAEAPSRKAVDCIG